MKPFIFLLSLFFISNFLLAQEKKYFVLQGKISANTNDLENINVINRTQEKVTTTNKQGRFSIEAIVGDELVFSSMQVKTKHVFVSKNDIDNPNFNQNLEIQIIKLDEVVVVRYENINAISLGIIKRQPKTMTIGERKLFAYKSGGPVFALIGALNGQTKYFKKVVEMEKNQQNISKLSALIDDEYLINKLKIPANYVEGFKYYVIEEKEVVDVIKLRNKLELEFILNRFALSFIKTINQKE